MSTYDSARFDPPAPVAEVAFRNPENGAIARGVPMLIDSGSDATLVPKSVAIQLNSHLKSGERSRLMGFDGEESLSPIVRLEMVFAGRLFRGDYVLIDQEVGILGRNILNNVALTLDGPRLTWSDARPPRRSAS